MSEQYLTATEFKKMYPGTGHFFKHQDRYDKQFYEFYGIEKTLIKPVDGYYRIPTEAAPILNLMINSYDKACGFDDRKRNVKTGTTYEYNLYHTFVHSLRTGLHALPNYQKAFIESYSSYHLTVIIDTFLPILIERLALLLIAFFEFNHTKSLDFIIQLFHLIDKTLERMVEIDCSADDQKNPYLLALKKRLLKSGAVLGQQTEENSFSFEKAIGDSFRFFVDPQYQPTPEIFTALDYSSELWKIKQNLSSYKMEGREKFEEVYQKYKNEFDHGSELFERNFKEELDYLSAFLTAKTNAELSYWDMYTYPIKLSQTIKSVFPYIDYIWKVDFLAPTETSALLEDRFQYLIQLKTSDDSIGDPANHDQMEADIKLLYQYKEELSELLKCPCDINDFINKCIEKRRRERDGLIAKIPPEHTDSTVRESVCDFYKRAKESGIYHEIVKRLDGITSLLLPIKFE